MKIRHNKKRNTAFVYEALIVEATVAILKKDKSRQATALSIIKKHFKPGSVLKKDLECYQSLKENQNLNAETSKRIINEARLQRRLVGEEGLFTQQTAIIHDINKDLSSAVFNNFVPNYKSLATIAQMFSQKTSPKEQIILENMIINNMTTSAPEDTEVKMDKLVYATFVEKFNKKYESDLLGEQKELLMHYVSSFTDNAVSLKVFLNEEVTRLKEELKKGMKTSEIQSDSVMRQKTTQVALRLDEFTKCEFSEDVLLTILKTQSLVKELSDGDQD
tara:strand:+ start:2270 stop:3097 length:828 start_codon:yes stop_codon:yes gene_type:complete